jgi:hypothetical protein
MKKTLFGFKRDNYSHALVNVDHDGLKSYIRSRDQALKIKNMTAEMGAMKQEINSLKSIIQNIFSKLG